MLIWYAAAATHVTMATIHKSKNYWKQLYICFQGNYPAIMKQIWHISLQFLDKIQQLQFIKSNNG
jgi:hypothetical protein